MSENTAGRPDDSIQPASAAQPDGGQHGGSQPSEVSHPDIPVSGAVAIEPVVEVQQLSIRRAPRIPVFLLLGGLVGFIVALILTTSFEIDPLVGFPAMLGYLSIYCVPAGIALGALVGLLLDRRSTKRARQLEVEHESVREAEPEVAQPDAGQSEAGQPDTDNGAAR